MWSLVFGVDGSRLYRGDAFPAMTEPKTAAFRPRLPHYALVTLDYLQMSQEFVTFHPEAGYD